MTSQPSLFTPSGAGTRACRVATHRDILRPDFEITGRGRDEHHCSPPAQIRTCAADAYGSYLG